MVGRAIAAVADVVAAVLGVDSAAESAVIAAVAAVAGGTVVCDRVAGSFGKKVAAVVVASFVASSFASCCMSLEEKEKKEKVVSIFVALFSVEHFIWVKQLTLVVAPEEPSMQVA